MTVSEAALRAAAAGRRGTEEGKRVPAAEPVNGGGEPPRAPVEHYDDLEADEIVTLVNSLEPDDLDSLLEYERAHEARPRVLSAIEGVVARRRTGQPG
jgi:hypothetical protein